MNKQANRSIRRLLDLVRSGRLKQSELVRRLEVTTQNSHAESDRLYALRERMQKHLISKMPRNTTKQPDLFSRLRVWLKGKDMAGGLTLPSGIVRFPPRSRSTGSPSAAGRLSALAARIRDSSHRSVAIGDALAAARERGYGLPHYLLEWKGRTDPTPVLGALKLDKSVLAKRPLFTGHLSAVDEQARIQQMFKGVKEAYKSGRPEYMDPHSIPFEAVMGPQHFKPGVNPLQAMTFMVPAKRSTGEWIKSTTRLKEDPMRRAYRGMDQTGLRLMKASPEEQYFYSGVPNISKGYAGIRDIQAKMKILSPTQKAKMMELFEHP
jgi:hypothetical protein